MNHPAYEILKGLPGYGPMYISIPPNNYNVYSEDFVVRFYKKDGSEWVGNFQLGFSNMVFSVNNESIGFQWGSFSKNSFPVSVIS